MRNIITLAGYTLNFISAICNPDDTQTWTYSISKLNNPLPEINYWLLKLYAHPPHIINISTGPTTVEIKHGQAEFTTIPTIISWNNLNNENVDGTYTFTIKGCFQKTEVPVIIKTNEYHYGTITGPSGKKIIKETKTDLIKTQKQPLPTRGIPIF